MVASAERRATTRRATRRRASSPRPCATPLRERRARSVAFQLQGRIVPVGDLRRPPRASEREVAIEDQMSLMLAVARPRRTTAGATEGAGIDPDLVSGASTYFRARKRFAA